MSPVSVSLPILCSFSNEAHHLSVERLMDSLLLLLLSCKCRSPCFLLRLCLCSLLRPSLSVYCLSLFVVSPCLSSLSVRCLSLFIVSLFVVSLCLLSLPVYCLSLLSLCLLSLSVCCLSLFVFSVLSLCLLSLCLLSLYYFIRFVSLCSIAAVRVVSRSLPLFLI